MILVEGSSYEYEWTPTVAKDYVYTIKVTDECGNVNSFTQILALSPIEHNIIGDDPSEPSLFDIPIATAGIVSIGFILGFMAPKIKKKKEREFIN